jgi:hypothetical protein
MQRMVRLLRLVLLAVIASVAILGVGTFGPRASHGVHAAIESIGGVRAASLKPTRVWRQSGARPVVYRDAVEANLDDDDLGERHARSALTDDGAFAFRLDRVPSRPARALRTEPQRAESRVAIGSGRLRGPPAA